MRDSVPAMLMTFESASKRRSLRAEPNEKVNDRLGSLSHVKLVIGRRTADAVGAFEREGKDGVDWALHLTGGMVEKCLRSVSSVGCRCLLAVDFWRYLLGFFGVFWVGCVFVSTLITRDIETF